MEQDQLITKMGNIRRILHFFPDSSDQCDKRFGVAVRVYQFILKGYDDPVQQKF